MFVRRAFLLSSVVAWVAGCGGVGAEGSSASTIPNGMPIAPPPGAEPEPMQEPEVPDVVAYEFPYANVRLAPQAITAEDSGAACTIAPLPTYGQLEENERLPDPFLSVDGTRIDSVDDWTCRRAELSAQVQEYELGPKPPRPSTVTGSFADNAITVTAGEGDRSISFTAQIQLPPTGTAPYPAMIAIGTSSLENTSLQNLGVAIINFPNGAVGEQMGGGSRGRGLFYDFYGSDHPAGAMMAWAWGVSRLIDALETTPEANIDPGRLGVTGCSRNGKGALVVGAFDERIDLTIPQESGAGGSSLWRVADVNRAAWVAAQMMPDYGDIQTLRQIVQENVWFRASFSQFAESATRLPFDHHMVMGLVAPRALFVVNNTDQYWLDREGSHYGALVAHRVWEGLGVGDKMGQSQVGGHGHCVDIPPAQVVEINAYVEKYLVGTGTGDTNVMYTDGGFVLDEARWVDWTVPQLAAAGG